MTETARTAAEQIEAAAIALIAHEVLAHDVHRNCAPAFCVLCNLAALIAARGGPATEKQEP